MSRLVGHQGSRDSGNGVALAITFLSGGGPLLLLTLGGLAWSRRRR